jgi:hypothetical protein
MKNKYFSWAALVTGLTSLIWMALSCLSILGAGDQGSIYDYCFSSNRNHFDAALWIFWLSIILIIGLLVFAILKSDEYAINSYTAVGVAVAVFAVATGIVSFCFKVNVTSDMAAKTGYSADKFRSVSSLGAGPILCGVFDMITAILVCFSLFFEDVFVGRYHYSAPVASVTPSPAPSVSAQTSPSSPVEEPAESEPIAPKKEESSYSKDEEVIELLGKYKKLLDDGVLTNEEFNAKKSELLKK